jgi:hypothetical protein
VTPAQDLFVGLLAIVVGCVLIGGAALDSAALMSLTKSRLLAESVGRTGARWMIAMAGAACFAMGVLIAAGWRVHW